MIHNFTDHSKMAISNYTVFFKDRSIAVAYENRGSFLLENDILYHGQLPDSFSQKDIYKVLSKTRSIPDDLIDFALLRSRDLRGEKVELYTDGDKQGLRFCPDTSFAYLYGITNPKPVVLTITEVFNNSEDFDKAFSDSEDEAFGFWDAERNEISSTFIWGHPSQTKICFSDFGNNAISKGSLFLKFRISSI